MLRVPGFGRDKLSCRSEVGDTSVGERVGAFGTIEQRRQLVENEAACRADHKSRLAAAVDTGRRRAVVAAADTGPAVFAKAGTPPITPLTRFAPSGAPGIGPLQPYPPERCSTHVNPLELKAYHAPSATA